MVSAELAARCQPRLQRLMDENLNRPRKRSDRSHLRAGNKTSGAANTGREFLSVAEVIEKLGVGRTLVYRLTANGEIKSVRIGCRRLVPAASYADYVRRLKEEAA